jgi:arsenate reductase
MDSLYFNPACSKCRSAKQILSDAGVTFSETRYLDTPPTVAELRELMRKLGIDDPRAMMRPGEPEYADIAEDAGVDTLLEAIAAHPILLERPIFVVGDRAVIGRPPERVNELL